MVRELWLAYPQPFGLNRLIPLGLLSKRQMHPNVTYYLLSINWTKLAGEFLRPAISTWLSFEDGSLVSFDSVYTRKRESFSTTKIIVLPEGFACQANK
jgi:hypothetical protein